MKNVYGKVFFEIDDLLGHGPGLQDAVSEGSPLQSHPPLAGVGEVQVLVLDFDPVAHVTLHAV